MNRKKAILTAVMMLFISYGTANAVSGPFGYDLQKDMHRSKNKAAEETKQEEQQNAAPQTNLYNPLVPKDAKNFYSFVPLKDLFVETIDQNTENYTNPTIKSAIARYNQGNYTGSLQELYAYIKKYPNDAYAYYCMGLAYTKIGENTAAKNCFQKAINCYATGELLDMALKGRDCITGGGFCQDPGSMLPTAENSDNPEETKLDQFINAPYTGNGFSPELQKEFKQKQLETLQKAINRKDSLNEKDLELIDKIQNKSEAVTGEKLAMSPDLNAEPSNTEVLEAIDVLKRAGLNISTTETAAENRSMPASASADVNPDTFTPSQEYQQINMMLGNNNSSGTDPMMTMLPYMMNSNNKGQNIDPQVIQAMMMNSMMNSLGSMNTTDNK